MSTFLISRGDQLTIMKLYVTTGSAKVLIALILLYAAFYSLLSIDLTLQKHFFQIFSLIQKCCIPSPLVTPYIHNFAQHQDL